MRATGTTSLRRSIGRVPALAALAALALGWHLQAAAAEGPLGKFPVPSVAVVDEGAVMNASIAVKSIKTQIDKIRTTYQKELAAQDADLRKMELALQSQGGALAPDVLAQRQKAIGDKAQAEREALQDRQRRLTAAFERAMLQVQGVAKQVVDEIAVEEHINLVLPTATVIDSLPAMNITDQVIKRLNARLTSVAVRIPN